MSEFGDELYAFFSNGRVSMGNNLTECVVKPFIINHKVFLFSKVESCAEASSMEMAMIRTVFRNRLIPECCRTWFFENASKLPAERLVSCSDDVLASRVPKCQTRTFDAFYPGGINYR